MRWAIVTLGFLVAAGCRWGTVDREDFENEYGPLSGIPAIGRSFFSPDNARELPAVLERAIGGRVSATSLEVRADRVSLTAFDPRNTDELNEYAWLDGSFQKPKPRRLSKDSRLTSFDIRDVPFEGLPEMVKRARAQFVKWKGITASVFVGRSVVRRAREVFPVPPTIGSTSRPRMETQPETPQPGPLHIVIHCDAPRGSGQVEFDAGGQILSVR
jgi:hypothetical protein